MGPSSLLGVWRRNREITDVRMGDKRSGDSCLALTELKYGPQARRTGSQSGGRGCCRTKGERDAGHPHRDRRQGKFTLPSIVAS